jgi:hypothetical protein
MIITSIVTGDKAFNELKLQLFTMSQWHKGDLPTYYIYTDKSTNEQLKTLDYKGKIRTREVLEKYKGMARKYMESMKGVKFQTIWTDLMVEKIYCIRWAFEEEGPTCPGVFFLDSDITLLAPMPTIPEGTDVALSPHHIRKMDTDKYGYYNGGFGWLKDPSFCDTWELETLTSRFYEQAALEEVAKTAKHFYEIPYEYNFGWWRIYQHETLEPATMFNKLGLHRSPSSAGITYDGKTLCSIHSHFSQKDDFFNRGFCGMIYNKLALLRSHKPAYDLFVYARKNFF